MVVIVVVIVVVLVVMVMVVVVVLVAMLPGRHYGTCMWNTQDYESVPYGFLCNFSVVVGSNG